jgi:hypothetical protein
MSAARTPHDRREGGFVAVWLALMLTALLAVAAFVVDLLHAYSEAQALQNAVDAAATAGVVHLPDEARAAEVARRVGDDNTAGVHAWEIRAGDVANRLEVTGRKHVATFFARVIGFDEIGITKRARAEYDPPVRMGSSRSTLGNVPDCPGGPASCSTGRFWLNVVGPLTAKHNGNAGMSLWCDDRNMQAQAGGLGFYVGRSDSCPDDTDPAPGPSDNTDAERHHDGRPVQYFVVEHRGAPGAALQVDIFDGLFVDVNRTCSKDDFVASPLTTTGTTRTSHGNHAWCTADHEVRWAQPLDEFPDPNMGTVGKDDPYDQAVEAGNGGDGYSVETTFELLGPDDTPRIPQDNPVLCSRHFEGYQEIDDAPSLAGWREWVSIGCAPTQPGVYFVRVLTKLDTEGVNNFSLRAYTGTNPYHDPAVALYPWERFAIYNSEPGAVGEFQLARVLPSSVERTLQLSFWDVGDAGAAGNATTLQILPPADATHLDGSPFDRFTECLRLAVPGPDSGPSPWDLGAPDGFARPTTPAPNCEITDVYGRGTPCDNTFPLNVAHGCPAPPAVYDPWADLPPPLPVPRPPISDAYQDAWHLESIDANGQWVSVWVTIPADYRCDPSAGDQCWLRLRVSAALSVSDLSTWSARLDGKPVRLVPDA